MKLTYYFKASLALIVFTCYTTILLAVYPATCPTMQKRNNGNGLWGDCAGQGIQAVAENMNAVQSNIVYYNELYSVRSGIAPNPVNADQGILNIAMDGIENETPFHILIYTSDGRLLENNEVNLHKGTNSFALNNKTLNNDLVFISISHPEMGVIHRQKLVVKH
jgi:hypothetical protein